MTGRGKGAEFYSYRMKTPVTMQNIADRLGLSQWTVSMALRDHGKVAKATRAKVQTAARKMGYRPNLAAAMLVSLRYKTPSRATGVPIAHIDIHPRRQTRQDIGQVKTRADELGYKVHDYQISSVKELPPLLRTLYFRGFAGIILENVIHHEVDLATAADWSPFAVVGIGAYIFPIPFHRIKPHYFNAVKMAWGKAVERGYKRIGAAIFEHNPPVNDDYLRLGAVLAMQQKTARPRDRVPPLLCAHEEKAEFLKWVHKHRPDAIISFHFEAYEWLELDGVRIPDEVGFISLQDSTGAGDWGKTVCSLNPNYEAVMSEAVNFLDQRIRHGDRGVPEHPISSMVESTWHEGQSLPVRQIRQPKPRSLKGRELTADGSPCCPLRL